MQCRLAIPDRGTSSVPRRDHDDARAVLDVVQDDPPTPHVLGFYSGRGRLASQAAPAIARSPPVRNYHANTARCIKSRRASRLSQYRHLKGRAAHVWCRAWLRTRAAGRERHGSHHGDPSQLGQGTQAPLPPEVRTTGWDAGIPVLYWSRLRKRVERRARMCFRQEATLGVRKRQPASLAGGCRAN